MKNQLFNYILVGFVLYGYTLYAQNKDTIQQLKEVVISDVKLKENSVGIKIQELNDSILSFNSTNLTTLLRFNSNLYTRELSIGGTSTVSFRGTSASQTGVIWNGLNINSQSSGQTDLNTINVRNYNSVNIRSGGGSIAYGSGAVGGTIHLNSDFKFKKHIEQRLITSIGSYNTLNNNYKISLGSKKAYGLLAFDYVESENDYPFLGEDGEKNENADYENYTINYDAGFYLGKKHLIKFFNNVYFANRNFSNTLFSIANDGYENRDYRHMFQYVFSGKKITSTLTAAYLYEKYKYVFNTESPDNFDFGRSENYTLKYNLSYNFSENIQLKTIAQYEAISGDGSNIETVKRPRASLSFLFTHKLSNQLDYSFNVRQEVNDFDNLSLRTLAYGFIETYFDVTNFNKEYENSNDNPFIISLGSNYSFSKNYSLRFNASKNFRTPTFNDLYWAGLGNPDLLPEKSVQAELTNQLSIKGFNLGLTGFYIKSKDLITWQPNSSGVWRPINIDKVYNYGLETELRFQKKWQSHVLDASLNANYIISEDKASGDQLLYKPKHVVAASLAYNYKKIGLFYQFKWNDKVNITTDGSSVIEAYDVSNIGFNYKLYSNTNKSYTVGFFANNIYNEIYFLDAARPAPNRNYKLQILLNF